MRLLEWLIMLQVTEDIRFDESQVEFQFIRSGGPGGQNVNKVATAVQLRFDLKKSGLPVELQERLIRLAGKKVSQDQVLLMTGRRFRTQERNRQDVMDRLVQLIRRAAVPVRKRKRTRPSAGSVRRRLQEKRQRSEKKRERGSFEE